MKLETPHTRLVLMQWAIMTAVAVLEILPRLTLESPFHVGFLGLRFLALGVAAFVCSRLNAREPELAVGLFTVFVAVFAALDVRTSPNVWRMQHLEPLMYGAIGVSSVYGLSILWGVRGLLAGFAVAVWVVALGAQIAVQVVLAVMLLLTGLAGWLLHLFFHELDEVQYQLALRANTDAMTRLGNRRAFEDDFRRFRANAKRFGVPLLLMSWDVDGLKRINDTEGHAAGDAHLLGFVAALRAMARQGDGLYRIGGDEFVSLHPGLSRDNGSVLYKRVLQRFGHVSAGWVRATNDALELALEEADAQLYTEKEARKMAKFRYDRDDPHSVSQ